MLVARSTGQEDFMSTSKGSLLERFIRFLTRDTPQSQQDRADNRQEPHRWLNLR
jgi:hypothetical protein